MSNSSKVLAIHSCTSNPKLMPLADQSAAAPRWEQNFPGGDGVLYFPTGSGQVPVSGDDRTSAYELVDISTLWGLRDEGSIFTDQGIGVGGRFLGNDGLANAASPPWRWGDQDKADIALGVLFLDPALWINRVHDGAVPWPMEYMARSYDRLGELPSLIAKFDWSMPARFGKDSDGGGLIDYFETLEAASPSTWPVHLNACGSVAPGGSIAEYLWTIDGVEQGAQSSCNGSTYGFPAEGAYQVQLTVTSRAGEQVAKSMEVVVQDWLIVSLGDSYASGQGVPDIPNRLATGVLSDRCRNGDRRVLYRRSGNTAGTDRPARRHPGVRRTVFGAEHPRQPIGAYLARCKLLPVRPRRSGPSCDSIGTRRPPDLSDFASPRLFRGSDSGPARSD